MAVSKDILNIAVVNFKPIPGDKVGNLSRIEGYAVAAAGRGAQLVLFPEMALIGYGIYDDSDIPLEEKLKLAETTEGNAIRRLEATAAEESIYIVFGMAEKETGSDILYNSAAVIGPDGLIGTYRKIHPWGRENTWCSKGDKPFLFDSPWGMISVSICYDTYQFPELARYCIWKGSRLHLNPTALAEEVGIKGSRASWKESYEPHLKYLVLANSVYVASANLTGWDRKQFFGGGSVVMGPATTPFSEPGCAVYAGDMDNYQEELFIGTIDLSLAARPLCRENPYGGGTDYRPRIYRMLFDEIGS